MDNKNRLRATSTRLNDFVLASRKITPFILVFGLFSLFLLHQVSLAFFVPSEDTDVDASNVDLPPTNATDTAIPINTPTDLSLNKDDTKEKIPILTRLAKPDSFSRIEERERIFAEKAGTEGVTINVLKDEDLDRSYVAQSDSIDEAQFYIHISNNTKENLPLLQILTGIKEGTLNYIRVEGATGYFWKNGELVLAYVSLLPDTSTTVTVTGFPIISSEPVILDITPTLMDFDSNIISQGPLTKKIVAGKEFSLTKRFMIGGAKVDNKENIIEGTTKAPSMLEEINKQ